MIETYIGPSIIGSAYSLFITYISFEPYDQNLH